MNTFPIRDMSVQKLTMCLISSHSARSHASCDSLHKMSQDLPHKITLWQQLVIARSIGRYTQRWSEIASIHHCYCCFYWYRGLIVLCKATVAIAQMTDETTGSAVSDTYPRAAEASYWKHLAARRQRDFYPEMPCHCY